MRFVKLLLLNPSAFPRVMYSEEIGFGVGLFCAISAEVASIRIKVFMAVSYEHYGHVKTVETMEQVWPPSTKVDPPSVITPAALTWNWVTPATCHIAKSDVLPLAALMANWVPLAEPTNLPAVVPSNGPAPREIVP